MRSPLVPKGRAMSLHLTKEYQEGKMSCKFETNPYDFFNEYEKHYAWDIGRQNARRL